MPFKKVGPNNYVSPSGHHFTLSQVQLWHAHGGKFPGQKGPGELKKDKSTGIKAHISSYVPFSMAGGGNGQ